MTRKGSEVRILYGPPLPTRTFTLPASPGVDPFPIGSNGKRAPGMRSGAQLPRCGQGVTVPRSAHSSVLFRLAATHGRGAGNGATGHADDPLRFEVPRGSSVTTERDHLDLMTAVEVAAVLRVGVRTAIRKLDGAGVPSVRLGGKLRYWRRSAVASFIAASETSGRGRESSPRRGRPVQPTGLARTSELAPSEKRARAARIAHVLAPARPRHAPHGESDG